MPGLWARGTGGGVDVPPPEPRNAGLKLIAPELELGVKAKSGCRRAAGCVEF